MKNTSPIDNVVTLFKVYNTIYSVINVQQQQINSISLLRFLLN